MTQQSVLQMWERGVAWKSRVEQWAERPRVKTVLLTLYYVFLVMVLIGMYGRGDFSAPPFVYQEF